MMPNCPPHYTCTFTPKNPPLPGPWWEHSAGIAVAIVGIVALAIVLTTLAYYLHTHLTEKANRDDRRRQNAEAHAHALAIEEQRTMQLDAAKGNPEVLRLVQEMARK